VTGIGERDRRGAAALYHREFKSRSRDEIGVLTEAIGRMKTSLVQAMKMLDSGT
jgi:protein-histidine pros-kinase